MTDRAPVRSCRYTNRPQILPGSMHAEFVCKGHLSVKATHRGSFELAEGSLLSERGTCIVGVDPQYDALSVLRLRGEVQITLRCGAFADSVRGRMNPKFLHGDPLVFRTFPNPQWRSICIGCDKDAAMLDRRLVRALCEPGAVLHVRIERLQSQTKPQGILYLIGSPLGNHEDLSPRALRTLRSIDLLLAEDTRTVKPILKASHSTARVISYHDHNEADRLAEVLRELDEGARVGLISEAGMPLISDPGFRVTAAAAERGCLVSPVPSGDAITSALCVSGLPVARFDFVGFLPRELEKRRAMVAEMSVSRKTSVFFESPHRIEQTLSTLCTHAPERRVAICMDLTKRTERIVRGFPAEVRELCLAQPLTGELAIVMEGSGALPRDTEVSNEVMRMIDSLVLAGTATKTIATAVTAATGMKRRVAFALVVSRRHGDLQNAAYGDE